MHRKKTRRSVRRIAFEHLEERALLAVTVPVLATDSGDAISFASELTIVEEKLYFESSTPESSNELWRHDPSTGETGILADINPGSAGSYPRKLVELNGQLFFVADDGVHGRELWRHDPATAQTAMVADINPSGDSMGFTAGPLAVVAGQLFFVANDGTNGDQIWRHDPAEGVVERIAPFNFVSLVSLYSGRFAELDDDFYFVADDGAVGTELWVFDTSTNTTALISDIRPGAGSSYPGYLTAAEGKLFFTANDGIHGYELWTFNPSTSSAGLAADINPGFASSYPSMGIDLPNGSLTAPYAYLDGSLFFSAHNVNTGSELWRYDIAERTATVVTDTETADFNAKNAIVFQNDLYFSGRTDATGAELMRYDSETQTVDLVGDLYPGTQGSSPAFLLELNEILYFVATTQESGREPMYYDPVTLRVDVIDLSIGGSYSYPRELVSLDGKLYISSSRSVSSFGSNLVVYDPANQAPVANAGGPYTVVQGSDVELDGSMSDDDSDLPLAYAWDLDGDNQFDDASGVSPTIVPNGLAAGVYTISLRVTDEQGLTHTASTTLEVITPIDNLGNSVNDVMEVLQAPSSTVGLGDGELSSILAKLNSVDNDLQSDNTRAATGKLTATLRQLDAIINRKSTSTTTAATLTLLSVQLEEALSLL